MVVGRFQDQPSHMRCLKVRQMLVHVLVIEEAKKWQNSRSKEKKA